jgi:hypothetical protein
VQGKKRGDRINKVLEIIEGILFCWFKYYAVNKEYFVPVMEKIKAATDDTILEINDENLSIDLLFRKNEIVLTIQLSNISSDDDRLKIFFRIFSQTKNEQKDEKYAHVEAVLKKESLQFKISCQT